MIDPNEPILSYDDFAKARIEVLKAKFAEITKIGEEIRAYPNKLEKTFYLGKQDELSEIYESICSEYLAMKTRKDEAEAVNILAVKDRHVADTKAPTAKIIDAEVMLEIKGICLVEKILESWWNITRNYITTCRSHVNALNGRSSDDASESN